MKAPSDSGGVLQKIKPETGRASVALPQHNHTATAAERIDVVYIVGCGRSGSTLLDLALSAHPRVTSVGEVCFHGRWAKNDYTCTCGAPFSTCGFWQEVTEKLRGYDTEVLVTPLAARAEKISALLSLSLGKTHLASARARAYALPTYRLFRAVQEVSNKPIVLDSSKNPLRAFYLHASGLFNIKFIHLIRDGRAYLNSTGKPVKRPAQGGKIEPPKNAWRASWHWLQTNVLGNLLRTQAPQALSCVVRYEDFARDPNATMHRLWDFLELPHNVHPLQRDKDVRHNIAGSRWRFAGNRAIQLDEKWRCELSAARRLTFAASAGWLNRIYGYR